MKVMAISSSPRGGGQSKTEIMLSALVKGMREAGADVQEVFLRNHKVHYCTGCYTCWTKTPGVCQLKDDMTRKLFPMFLESDIVVYASPLYHFTMNACMKAFIERTLPMVQPFLVDKGGRTSHPLRTKPPASVMLSVAGFPEISVFQHLSSHVRFLFGKGLLGEIYRPAAELLSNPAFKRTVADILEATTEAGRELVESSRIKDATMQRITQTICDTESLRMLGDLMWKTCISEGVTTKEFQARGMVPRPDSIASFLAVMKIGFNPKKAADTQAVLQFTFTGTVEGVCYLAVDKGKIETGTGPAAKPDLSITAPFETWMDIITRKADGAQLFVDQKYTAEGNLELLMNMAKLFG